MVTVTQMALAVEMATAAGAALAAEKPTAAQMNGSRLVARTAAKAASAVEMDTTTTLGAEWQNTLLK